MPNRDYRNLNLISAAWYDWRSRPRIATAFGLITAGLSFLAGSVVVPPENAELLARIGAGFLGLLILVSALIALFLLWALLAVPLRQRDESRQEILTLRSELNERDRIEFTLTPSFESTGGDFRGLRQLQTLWVEVMNEGRVAEFAARIPPTALPVSRFEDGLVPETIQVYNVAWEQTLDWRNTLGVGRLRLATVAAEPEGVFWFWTASNATFNPDSHGVGWRLRPSASVIQFPLVVSNLTDRKSVTQTCTVEFGPTGLLRFALLDSEL